jgi:hypothetical protein
MNEQVNILISLLLFLTSQNFIHEEIKSKLNPERVSYHLDQNVLTSCPLSKHIKIKIYRTTILPVHLCGCEIWCLTLRKEHCLRVLKNNLLR